MARNIFLILEEIKKRTNIKKDKDLASLMGVRQNTLSSWKKRGTIPYKEIIALCDKLNISLLDALEGKTDTFVAEDIPEYGFKESAPLDEIDGKIITLLRTMQREEKIETLRCLEDKKLLREIREEREKEKG